MQELTRRTVLRLGGGLAGVCALEPIWQLGLATAAGAPPDQPSPSSAKGLPTLMSGLVRVSGARRRRDGMVYCAAAGPSGAAATGDRAARSRHDGVGRDGYGSRAGPGPAGQGRLSAVRGGRGRRREQLVAPTGDRRGLGRDGAHRAAADAGDQGPGHVARRVHRLVDGWLRLAVARRDAWSGAYRRDLRGRPCVVSRITARPSRRARSMALRTGSRTRCTALPRFPRSRIRIDCGDSDRYYKAVKQFVASLRRPPAGVSFDGGHDVAAWREKLPRELAWLAR